jgi:hypothetical protein
MNQLPQQTAVVRIDPSIVFPHPSDTAEGYFERMKILRNQLENEMKALGIPHDEPPKREGLARSIAREVMETKDVSETRKERAVMDNVKLDPKHPGSFVLDSAKSIVYGPRQHMYGHASVNFARTAEMWEPLFGGPVSNLQVGLAMILLKVSRGANLVARELSGGPPATFAEIEDTLKDIAGYAEATMRSLFEAPDGRRTTD